VAASNERWNVSLGQTRNARHLGDEIRALVILRKPVRALENKRVGMNDIDSHRGVGSCHRGPTDRGKPGNTDRFLAAAVAGDEDQCVGPARTKRRRAKRHLPASSNFCANARMGSCRIAYAPYDAAWVRVPQVCRRDSFAEKVSLTELATELAQWAHLLKRLDTLCKSHATGWPCPG
jgi:hypothetical protein